MSKLLSELSRRHVFRVAAAYVVVAWIVLQLGAILFATFEAPGWVAKVFTTLIFLGFPIAVLISWAFELTPEGIKKTESGEGKADKAPMTDLVLVGLLVVVVGSYIVNDLRTIQSHVVAGSPVVQRATTTDGDLSAVQTGEDDRVSVAVLPFANMSSDTEQQYFSDGITEEILNALAHIDGLKVTSRTSSFAFKSSPDDLPTVARKLGVSHILEGSVRRSGDMLRITAQLIRAADDAHLWSQTYDRNLKNIFQVQEEISVAIAAALRLRLVDEGVVSNEIDPQTYDLYLRALENIDRGSFADMESAIERLERVIEAAPDFARAHSGLARAISFSLLTGAKTGSDWLDRMASAGHQALAIDRQSKEAYATLGTAAYLRGDLRRAIDNYAHAERLSALGMWDHFTYAGALVDRGEINEAIRMSEAAAAADPLNQSVYYGIAIARMSAGDAAAGLSALKTAREIEPKNPNAYYFAGTGLYGQGGRAAEALVLAEAAYVLDPADPEIQTLNALGHLSLGNYSEAERWIEEALGNDPDIGFALGVKGLILAARGEREVARVLALRALEPETGAKNFRFAGNNMLIHLAYPEAAGGSWSDKVRGEFQRHWPELFQYAEEDGVWAGTDGGIVSPAALASVDYIAHLKAEGKDQEADRLAKWLKANLRPSQFWTFAANSLLFAELAMAEGDEARALDIIEHEVAEGFVFCWQWRLRDNPYFTPLRTTPRFQAALAGVARNTEKQKARYAALKAGGDKAG